MKACIWFYFCAENQTWMPPMFWDAPVDAETFLPNFFRSNNVGKQYLVSIYYSILMLKPNEIAPRANSETILCTVILIIDLIVAASVSGSVAVLVQMANRRANKFEK